MKCKLIGGVYSSNKETDLGVYDTYADAKKQVEVDRGRFCSGYLICGKSFDYYHIKLAQVED